jgi:hypothetical protein
MSWPGKARGEGRRRPLEILSRGQARAIVAAALALACLMTAGLLGAPYLHIDFLLGDLWFVLDSIWRVSLGQQPNLDFVTPLGPVFYGIYDLLTAFEPPSLWVMVHANLLVGLLAALLCFGVGRGALRPELLALLMLLAFLTAASGRGFGTPFAGQDLYYVAPYNRWGWAIALPTAFALLMPKPRLGAMALAGLGLALLYYLKISYFAVLLALAPVALLLDRRDPAASRRALSLFGSLFLGLAIGALYASPVAYLADIRSVAAANLFLHRVERGGLLAVEAGLFLGLALLVHHLASRLRRISRPDLIRLVLMIGAGAAILVQNHDRTEAPLYFGALILALLLGLHAADRDQPARTERPAFTLLLLLLLVPITADVGITAYSTLRARLKPAPPIADFQGTPLAPLRSGSEQIEIIRDGLILLNRMRRPTDRILPLFATNPFPALTGTPAPRGVLAWWHPGRTFTETNAPPADQVLGDVTLILVPRQGADLMLLLYGGAIQRGYRPVGASAHWTALRRIEAR